MLIGNEEPEIRIHPGALIKLMGVLMEIARGQR